MIPKSLKEIEPDIFGTAFDYNDQATEVEMRGQLTRLHCDYWDLLKRYHSMPVMDLEISKFLELLPNKATVLDVGGGWGWHWRYVDKLRPDIKVLIIDLVIENLRFCERSFG